jgi:hypothetical protein
VVVVEAASTLGFVATAEVPAAADALATRAEAAELVTVARGAAAALVAAGASVAWLVVLAEVESVIGMRAF